MDLGARFREELVDGMVGEGVLSDPRWVRAFREVPREAFLPGFFAQREDGAWVPVTRGDPDWLRLVYRDDVRVTQLDGDDAAWSRALEQGWARGVPTSSSSMPAIMAIMLEALAVADGCRVLEIGTGTGYNAALLSAGIGSPSVVTVDVDPAVLSRARAALAAAGWSPECALADGAGGWPEAAPYDRVLGTCAVSRVPLPWLEQTRPGGVVVTALNRPLGAGLIRLTALGGTRAEGRVLAEDGRFMPLRAHAAGWAEAALARAATAVPEETRATALGAHEVVHPGSGYEFFAGLVLRGAVVTMNPVLLAHEDGSWARPRGGVVSQGGPRRLWAEAEEGHREWQALGRPRRSRFGVTVDGEDQRFWLDAPEGRSWPV
ncbi:methyltransferase domain-containing protein [Actinosynnema sp.]|uniref:methyltransferase domain-containing protein n=1 Tax=Actinosynnema sp. TaxID=1872144 RepID=UPI003F836A94